MQISEFPDLPQVLRQATMRALTAQHEGRLFEADRLFHQIAVKRPLHPLLAYTASGFRLLKGDCAGAWALAERRLELPYYTHRPFAHMDAPMWDGSPMPDGRLLIFCDLGLGDTILLARFLPWVQARVGGLAMQVNTGTAAFWRHRLPDAEISGINDPLPACTARINMFCLPRLFGATAENMPPPGYIHSRADERAHWRARLSGDIKVGLSWQGNPDHVRDFERSIPFDRLRAILDDPVLRGAGVRFFSLQLHQGRTDAADAIAAGEIEDLTPGIMARDPLEASAALIDELDLVIAVDSALANLAGAMNRPFWLPTYKVPDWRWRNYPSLDFAAPLPSPWYGSARVFACGERQVWEPVVADMHKNLRDVATRPGAV